MNKLITKLTVGLMAIGLITGIGVLATNGLNHEEQLSYIAKNQMKSSSLKEAEQELSEAENVKVEAEEKVETAKEEVKTATIEKEKAEEELKNATTEEAKQEIQAKIDAANDKIEKAEEKVKVAEQEVQEATDKVQEATQKVEEVKEAETTTSTTTTNSTTSSTTKEAATNSTTTSTTTTSTTTKKPTTTTTKKATTTTKKVESQQGPKYDLNNYPSIMEQINKQIEAEKKKMEEEAKKKTVEFHFYSTNRTLTVHCTESFCGKSYYIWSLELECNPEQCEGFYDSKTGKNVPKLLVQTRADTTSFTFTAPAPKYGYRFVGWELISARKTAEASNNFIFGKYIATYEKIK